MNDTSVGLGVLGYDSFSVHGSTEAAHFAAESLNWWWTFLTPRAWPASALFFFFFAKNKSSILVEKSDSVEVVILTPLPYFQTQR